MKSKHSMNKRNSFLLSLAALLLIAGCTDKVGMPKPKGYPRIDLPAHSYKPYANDVCPFTFELPAAAVNDSVRTDSCWMNFYYPQFDYRWHITYRHIPSSGKSRQAHFDEYHTLVYKHIQKSTRINEIPIRTEKGSGVFYELYGSIGVPSQFIFGDDTHLIMTSFYFPTAVDIDSLSPVINFVKEDLMHLVNTLDWK